MAGARGDVDRLVRLALQAESRGDSKVAAKHYRAAARGLGALRRTKGGDAAGEAYALVTSGWRRLEALLPDPAARQVLDGIAELAIAGIVLRHRVKFQPRAMPEPTSVAAVKFAVRALVNDRRRAKTITARTLNKAVQDYFDAHPRMARPSDATIRRCLLRMNPDLPDHWRR